jgi:hypothetical protein
MANRPRTASNDPTGPLRLSQHVTPSQLPWYLPLPPGMMERVERIRQRRMETDGPIEYLDAVYKRLMYEALLRMARDSERRREG